MCTALILPFELRFYPFLVVLELRYATKAVPRRSFVDLPLNRSVPRRRVGCCDLHNFWSGHCGFRWICCLLTVARRLRRASPRHRRCRLSRSRTTPRAVRRCPSSPATICSCCIFAVLALKAVRAPCYTMERSTSIATYIFYSSN